MKPYCYCLITILLFLAHSIYAQEIIQNATEQKLENLAETSQNEEIDFLNSTETLTYYKKHPINLNNTSKQTLVQLGLLNDIQINNLLCHIEKNGALLELYELQSIDGFNLAIIQNLLPYVKISDEKKSKIALKGIFKYGSHSLFIRSQQVLEKQKGFMPVESDYLNNNPNSRYLGSKQKIYARYRFTCNDNISAGIIADKDAGELFFGQNYTYTDPAYNKIISNKLKTGFDFYSAHLFISNRKIIKALVVGDYQVDFGQGLTAKNTFRFGKSTDVIAIQNNAAGIRPHLSADENLFMRGIALTAGGKTINTSVFFSKKKVDANIRDTDSLTQIAVVSTLQTTGLHTTFAELSDKHSLIQTVIGSNISYFKKKYNLGITGTHTILDSEIEKPFQPYNQFQLRGKEITNAGMDYNIHLKNLNFFGEVSFYSTPNTEPGYAFTNGCILSVDPKVSLSLLHRSFSRGFQNLFANVFAESTSPTNEKGFYWGINLMPVKTITINAYCDHYFFPWLKYNVNAPSSGSEYMIQLNYCVNKNFETYLQVNTKKQLLNSNRSGNIDFIAPYNRTYYKWNLNYRISSALVLRNRIQLIAINPTDNIKQNGYMIFQDIIWKPFMKTNNELKNKLSLTFRYALFDTPGYDSRIYTYEYDIPGSYSIPSYYYKGERIYVMLNCNIARNLEFWMRLSQTYYSDRNTISPNTLNEINGNTKSEIKIAVRVGF